MSSEAHRIVEFAQSRSAEELIASVNEHDLPPVLESLVNEYVTFEGARDHFMWKWVHELAPQNTLPCVAPAHVDTVPTDKTLTILFVTLLDDVLEKHRDRPTFEEAAKVPFPERTVQWDRDGVDVKYVKFAQRVWETLEERLRTAPEFEMYAPLLRYDIQQAINAIEYTSLVIDRPDLATMDDLERYESHNMAMFAYADIDLMHSPPTAGADLSTLRRAVGHAQRMARIGNWVSTWERELREADYSSGVLVYALEREIITSAELAHLDRGTDAAAFEAIVDRIRDHCVEEALLDTWDDHYRDIEAANRRLDAFDLTPYIEGLKEVLRYHLASEGLK